MCLLGVPLLPLPIQGVKFPQKTPLWGCEYAFSSTTCKILKPAYYLRIDSNQILHNTKDHEVLIVGGPNKRQQIQDGRRPHFEKNVKSPYPRNHLADFDFIWHGDAHRPPTVDRPLKFRIFENRRWRRLPSGSSGHHLENQKIAIFQQQYDRSHKIWHADAEPFSMPNWPLKISEF